MGLAQIYRVLFGSLIILFFAGFLRRYFSLSFYMTFLSHPSCSSGFIQDFLNLQTALQKQKIVSPFVE